MQKAHIYECSNWFNSYSGQRYPVAINSVRYTDIVGKKTPNGMLCVSAEDVDGHFCSLLKCYKNARGERAIASLGGTVSMRATAALLSLWGCR